MGINKARTKNPIQVFNPAAAIQLFHQGNYNPCGVGNQHPVHQKTISVKNIGCRKFSIQNEWLIYCKFAARARSVDNIAAL